MIVTRQAVEPAAIGKPAAQTRTGAAARQVFVAAASRLRHRRSEPFWFHGRPRLPALLHEGLRRPLIKQVSPASRTETGNGPIQAGRPLSMRRHLAPLAPAPCSLRR